MTEQVGRGAPRLSIERRSAGAMKDFLDFVQTSPGLDTATIRASMEKNDGMTVSFKIR